MENTEMNAANSANSLPKTTAIEGEQAILLVEDEGFVREVTCEVLRAAGHVVWKARTASEAVRVFRKHAARIKLLIVDMMLPDRSGSVLALELEGMGGAFRTILISGYPERALESKLNMLDCVYLAKPFSADLLIRKVQEAFAPSRFPLG